MRFLSVSTGLMWIAVTAVCSLGCRSQDANTMPSLNVFAASSLTDVVSELNRDFEGLHPVDVNHSFAGSQVLRIQIEQGAPADVYVSANATHMDALTSAGIVTNPTPFANTDLVVIVPNSNPAGITSFSELTDAKKIILGTADVPIGGYARQVLERAESHYGGEFVSEVMDRVVSEETNVRIIRAKIEIGEADAAFVYRTDVTPGLDITVIEVPESLNVTANYHVGLLRRPAQQNRTMAWMNYIVSPQAQALLSARGFGSDS